MPSFLIRSYRPDLEVFDERPAVLSGCPVASDPAILEASVTAALAKRGNVVIQRVLLLSDGVRTAGYAATRAREAELAEMRRQP